MKRKALTPHWIHALRAGKWQGQNGPVQITDEQIKQIADSYNPELHKAPAVVGHPSTNHPAYGWVSAAEAREDGLWLNTDLQPELVERVRRQLYSKVSVSLYQPKAPANPTPGVFSLKHLGFLGAQPPAVKGLKPLALSDNTDDVLIINFTEEEEPPMDKKGVAALSKDDLAAKKAHEDREKKLQQREQELQRKEFAAIVDPHIQAGRVLPAQKSLVVALMERIGEDTISLSEGEEAKSLLGEFKSFLEKLPAQVDLSEVSSPADNPLPTAAAVINFSAPAGCTVDPKMAAVDSQAQAWLRQNPGKSYTEALSAIGVN